MKLVDIVMSQVTRLCQATRPKGQPYWPHLVSKIADQYRFQVKPETIADLEGFKLKFRHGLFDDQAIDSLEIYNDGIIVKCISNTDLIDRFIDELLDWFEHNYGGRFLETQTVGTMYESHLIIEANRDVFQPLESYRPILRMIGEFLEESSNLNTKFETYGLIFSADRTQISSIKPIAFRLERREGVEFPRQLFFSSAPLKTDQHLRILEQIPLVASQQ